MALAITATWADVVALAPELASVSGGTQGAILAAVRRQIVNESIGDDANDLVALLAAHLGTMSQRLGMAGSVASATMGPVGVSFMGAMNPEALQTTSYGQEYERRLSLIVGLRFVVL